MLAFGLALAILIVAAARPQRTVAVPIDSATIMLANDTSGSMAATTCPPRGWPPPKAADQFIAKVLVGPAWPDRVQHDGGAAPVPDDRSRAGELALAQLRVTGGTAIGNAIKAALHTIATDPRQAGRRPPGAILLLSDGASTWPLTRSRPRSRQRRRTFRSTPSSSGPRTEPSRRSAATRR